MKWTCEGSVRGCCGVNHRSYDTAWAHCERDHRAVMRGNSRGAYSDRYPVPMDDEAREQQRMMREDARIAAGGAR